MVIHLGVWSHMPSRVIAIEYTHIALLYRDTSLVSWQVDCFHLTGILFACLYFSNIAHNNDRLVCLYLLVIDSLLDANCIFFIEGTTYWSFYSFFSQIKENAKDARYCNQLQNNKLEPQSPTESEKNLTKRGFSLFKTLKLCASMNKRTSIRPTYLFKVTAIVKIIVLPLITVEAVYLNEAGVTF